MTNQMVIIFTTTVIYTRYHLAGYVVGGNREDVIAKNTGKTTPGGLKSNGKAESGRQKRHSLHTALPWNTNRGRPICLLAQRTYPEAAVPLSTCVTSASPRSLASAFSRSTGLLLAASGCTAAVMRPPRLGGLDMKPAWLRGI